jgi:hypothetical protein
MQLSLCEAVAGQDLCKAVEHRGALRKTADLNGQVRVEKDVDVEDA